MVLIGSHVSYKSDTQLLGSIEEALSYGANAFMFYTGAPQNTRRSPIDDVKTLKAMELMKEKGIKLEHVICHAPYIVNLANNTDIDKYQFAMQFLRNEIERCQLLGVRYLVLHPGSALKLDKMTALNNIVNALNKILLEEDSIVILLETMAGKGSECGNSLEDIAYILEHVLLKDKIGVCLDTCHLNDSGVNIQEFDAYLNLFDQKIGIKKIGCIHVNDSKNAIGMRKDRHENIGYGTIGFDALLHVIYHEKLKNVPKILETPYINREYPPYKFEIEMIRKREFNVHLYEDVLAFYKKKEGTYE